MRAVSMHLWGSPKKVVIFKYIAMDWFSCYVFSRFSNHDTLRIAIFGREKIPNDIMKKLKAIEHKEMLVEDFVQKFTLGET